jgi:hypothetical protein
MEVFTMTADILDRPPGPALSTTSDMPRIEPDPPPPEPEQEAEPEAVEATEEAPETPAEDAPPAAEPDAKPRPKSGINERFSDLTAARKAAEAQLAAERESRLRTEQLLAEALARIPKPETPSEPVATPPPVVEPRPVREAFDTPEAYDEALIEWSTSRVADRLEAERATHERAVRETTEREAAEKAQNDGMQTIRDAYTERRTKALEAMPDYAEVAEGNHWNPSLPMGLAIMQSEDGPAAAYYLGKHPEEAKRIADMVVPGQYFPAGNPMEGLPVPDVQRQLIEMGKVFATVAAEAAPPPTPKTPPPPKPISPLRSGNNGAVPKTLEEIGAEGTMEEYAALRMPVLQSQRRASGVFGRPE